KEWTPAKRVREVLQHIARALGLVGCEIFPKQDSVEPGDFGSWILMPYGPTYPETKRRVYDEVRKLEVDVEVHYQEWHRNGSKAKTAWVFSGNAERGRRTIEELEEAFSSLKAPSKPREPKPKPPKFKLDERTDPDPVEPEDDDDDDDQTDPKPEA